MIKINPNYLQTVFQTKACPPGWPNCFAVVTACNPNGVFQAEFENQKLDEAFRAELEKKNISYYRVTGGSPDFCHAEPGFAVAVDLDTSLALARQWQQEAIFWIEDKFVFVIPNDGSHRIKIGTWHSRLVKSNT